MNFEELQKELFARGFDDLNDAGEQLARVKRWLNTAYREIADYAPWPFLEATKEGTAPLEFTDLAHVLDVTDLAHRNELEYADRRELVAGDPNLVNAGVAERWYMEGEGTLKVYPADTASKFLVRYVKTPAELKEAADKPIVPLAYHELIVEGAVIRAYKNRDNYEAAQFVRAEWKLMIEQMVKALIKRNYDGERKILRTGGAGDYV